MATSSRPNIVLLVGEDTGRHLGCYGDPMAATPHLDRLAAEGTLYANAFSHSPVCAPSRSALVSGMYPWSLGTHHMRSTLRKPPRMFTHELRDAGYHVLWPNKTDFNFDPPEDYRTSDAPWWDQGLGQEPFFAYCNFPITHESRMWQTDEQLDELVASHGLARHNPDHVPVPAYLVDDPVVRRDIAAYYDNLAVQDARVGQALEAIERSGVAGNTVVIYLSDHGRGLPREKRWCYDAGIHLPLIVRAPAGMNLTQPGEVVEDLVGWVDLAPTILSLAGAAIPDHYQGRVFLGAGRSRPREFVYAGRDRMDEAFDRVRVARSRRWHYIRNFYPDLPYAQRGRYMEQGPTTQVLRDRWAAGGLEGSASAWMSPTKPPEELYDVQQDPECVANLADDPAHADMLRAMREELDRFLSDVPDLARESEQALIDRGLVTDRLDEYRERIAPLPEHQKIGPPLTMLTKEEAETWRAG